MSASILVSKPDRVAAPGKTSRAMHAVVSYPGTGSFAQQVGLAFLEHGALDAFVTTFAYRTDGALAHVLNWAPRRIGGKLQHNLERRSVNLLPVDRLKTYPFWEIVRSVASRGGANPILVDKIWDRMSQKFDKSVAARHVPGATAVYAYEYAAQETFERAHAEGIATILDVPSLSSRSFRDLQQAERDRFPGIRSPYDRYFDSTFERRQARRDKEIDLADIIVANSNLTRRSHIEHGADPDKIIVVPLAAPPTTSTVAAPFSPDRPLRVLWAGSFIVRKGAHYFLDAWRQLGARKNAIAEVYGSVGLPESALSPLPEGIVFKGAVPQQELFAAFDAADILAFPTLSDGFGMVVMEAFARGLPVVTTEKAGVADIVREGANGLIIPAGNPEALANALRWCMDNRLKLHEMRFFAHKTASDWQWADYRRAFIMALDGALQRTGFSLSFGEGASLERIR